MSKKKKKLDYDPYWGKAYDAKQKEKKKKKKYREGVLPQSIKDQIADSLERCMELKKYCIVIDNASRAEHSKACDMVYDLIDALRDGSPEAEEEVLDIGACQRYMEELEEFEAAGRVEDY